MSDRRRCSSSRKRSLDSMWKSAAWCFAALWLLLGSCQSPEEGERPEITTGPRPPAGEQPPAKGSLAKGAAESEVLPAPGEPQDKGAAVPEAQAGRGERVSDLPKEAEEPEQEPAAGLEPPRGPTPEDVLAELIISYDSPASERPASSIPAAAVEPGPAEGSLDLEKARSLLAEAALRQGAPDALRGGPGDGAAAPEPPAETKAAAPPAPAAQPSPSPPPPAQAAAPKPEKKEAGAPAPAVASGAPAPAAKPEAPAEPPKEAQAPSQAEAQAAVKARPKGRPMVKELYHKTSDEVMRFLRDTFPEWVENGNVTRIEGKGRSLVVIGDTPEPADATAGKILSVLDEFDDLELKLESRKIRPRFVDVRTVMDTLVMRGLANVWQLTEETSTRTWKEGDKNVSASHKHTAFAQTGLVQNAVAPIPVAPKIPYIYEVPWSEPFNLSLAAPGKAIGDTPLMDFRNPASTEERGVIMAVGTYEDIESIQAFVDSIDVPARQVMVEVQVIQLDANKLTDIGFDSFQFGQRHTLATGAFNRAGETIVQPGFGDAARRDPSTFVPDVVQEGIGLMFDDTSMDLSGRFITTLHALVREGDATIKARPKILTLDDRTSILHIGRTVPVFKSTGVTRDATVGNLVSEINNVDSIYAGFTLNLRPKVSGGAEDEVSLQIEVIVSEVMPDSRQRVFEEDLLGIPTILKRQFVGETRVKNHRPIVLGGLIQEQSVESVNKIPLLGDIPLLGWFFRRTVSLNGRMEVIFVLTPHILSDKGVDRAGTPKESIHFDTFDSVLFNDTVFVKGKDVIGIDPITGNPVKADGKIFTEEEVIDLTLTNIVKQRELVSKLGIIDDYLGDSAKELNWIQRKWPEATVHGWPEDKQLLYFRAAAIVIDNIKELNPDLTFDELVTPRRALVLPTAPYRISLTYDRVKALQTAYKPFLRGEKEFLSEATVALLRDASGRSLREFGDFVEARKRQAEDHGEMLVELKRMYSGQNPGSNALEGIPYPKVWSQLASGRFDFVAIATYFRENLSDRYVTTGPPNIGEFGRDLKAFLETSVSLQQRAKKLMELEHKWTRLNTEVEETSAEETIDAGNN